MTRASPSSLSLARAGSACSSALVLALALGLGLVLGWPWSPAPAYADAVVTVQLKDPQGQPVDGKVTLAGADGKPVASCSAQAGRCDMHGVAGGSYIVTVEPAKGAAPKPRKVMIPPSGNVSLLVATG